jgi:hypothetical protein
MNQSSRYTREDGRLDDIMPLMFVEITEKMLLSLCPLLLYSVLLTKQGKNQRRLNPASQSISLVVSGKC